MPKYLMGRVVEIQCEGILQDSPDRVASPSLLPFKDNQTSYEASLHRPALPAKTPRPAHGEAVAGYMSWLRWWTAAVRSWISFKGISTVGHGNLRHC